MERPNVRGTLKLVILDLLREPNHGYGVMAEMEGLYGVKLSAGTIYPILASLRRSGLIEVAEKGKRERKTYVITKKGLEYLERHNEELKEAKRKMKAYKLFLELGGEELKEAFKELFSRIEELDKGQKGELEELFKDCARQIRLIILGE